MVDGRPGRASLQQILTSDVSAPGAGRMPGSAFMLDEDAQVIDDVSILRLPPDDLGRDRYLLLHQPGEPRAGQGLAAGPGRWLHPL